MRTPHQLVLIFIVLLTAALLPARAAYAQSRPVSLTDTRQTRLVIRTIQTYSGQGVISMDRLSTNTDRLLTSLDARSASDSQLTNVGNFYKRSITAARFRQAARINAAVDRQLLRLRALANSTNLQTDLQTARDEQITLLIGAEAGGLASIDASVTTVLTN